MDSIQDKILSTLAGVEMEHRIKIPIAVESGSRAWGFASPDSDYDCRFIYVRRPDDYLTVFDRKDTIDFTPDAIYDIGGWDVRKVIAHLVKANAVMFEWLRSGIIYRHDERIHRLLWKLGEEFFNPVSVGWHYLSMAKNKLDEVLSQDESKLKTYCYILRPLAAARYIQSHGSIPFMEYRHNLDATEVAPDVRGEIDLLLSQKETALESDTIGHNQALVDYFKAECGEIETWLSTLRFEKNRDYAAADECFRQIVGMVTF